MKYYKIITAPKPVAAKRWYKDGDNDQVRACNDAHDLDRSCGLCGNIMRLHGWMAPPGGRRRVCPGAWIVQEEPERPEDSYPVRPITFKERFIPESERQKEEQPDATA